MKVAHVVLLTGGLWFGAILSSAPAASDDMASLERQFRELPIDARRLTGPLFWLHGDESRQRLEMYVGKVAEGGNGCFTAESRPHSDWLGPGWFRDLAICLEAAKKHNLKMWIFDEKWWPSQGVGGHVPPRYAAKRLEAASTDVEGPRAWEAEGYAGDRYIAAVAGRLTADGKVEGDSLVDLAPHIRDGKLSWQVPAGKWRIMKFTHVQAPALGQNGQLSVDGASKDCVDWFLQTVYQPHYDHFKADFGKTILGFFYDEPETRGDWGTELNRVLAEWKVDWKKAYVAYKFELAGEEQIAARYQYLDAFAETWGRTMYGGMTDWCHRHGVTSHGHFMEHAGLYHNRDFCAGDMMRLQGHSDMGGIDAVFTQFIMGKREEAMTPPIWQTPKIASSDLPRLRQAGRRGHGGNLRRRGQDLTYREMKWWTDHMQVSGVNFMIPHSFNPRAPYDTDCPPYFYNGGYRAALAAVSRLRRLHQPAEPDAHRRPARLPGGVAVYGAERQVGAIHPAGGHDDRPARCPTRLRLAALLRVRGPQPRGRQGTSTLPGTIQGADRSAGGSDSVRHAGEGQGVLRGRRRGHRLRLPAVEVGHAGPLVAGDRRVVRGDLGRGCRAGSGLLPDRAPLPAAALIS